MIGLYVVALCLVSGSLGAPAKILSEYQDSMGQYSFGYSGPQSARSEIRLADGKTRGAFSFLDAMGVLQTAQYTADSENGFRIEATYLPQAPQPVQDTPEVMAAREAHFKAIAEAQKIEDQASAAENGNELKQIKEQEILKMEEQKPVAIGNEEIPMQDSQENLVKAAHVEGKSANAQSENAQQVNLGEVQKVPIVTTSFVVPASKLNLQNRIELKSSGQSYNAPSVGVSQGIIGSAHLGRRIITKDGSASVISGTTGYSPYSSLFLSPYAPTIYPYAHYRYVPTFAHII